MHGFFPHQWQVHLTNWGCDKMVAISETTLANLVSWMNKANLRDLIVATGLVILLKLDSNRWFFNLCDLEIWWMTSKNYRTPLLHYVKLCASSQTPRWIQTGISVRKRSIRVKIGVFLSRGTLKFDRWSWKTIGHLFYATLTFVHHFKDIGEFKTLNSGQNRRFFVQSDLEIWWITLKNKRQPFLCCFKPCASFHSHLWIQTKVTVRKRSIRVKMGDLLSPVTLKFDGWPWKTAGHLFYVAWRFMHHSIATSEFKQKLQPRNAQYGWKSVIFVLCDREILRMTLKNNRAPRLCYFKLCASYHSHWWIQTGVTVRKCPIWIQIVDFLAMWPWNLRDDMGNKRAPLLSNIKLYASFHHHMWIQTGVTVRKRLSWIMTSLTWTFDVWPWPFVWTSLLSLVITPENFVIWWWEHSQKGVTDRQTDRRTDWTIHRAAWSQLKMCFNSYFTEIYFQGRDWQQLIIGFCNGSVPHISAKPLPEQIKTLFTDIYIYMRLSSSIC